MLVRDIMRTPVVTIQSDTTLPEAIRLAAQRGIRHLPVLEEGKLVGLVSDRDLKRAMASSATSLEVHELTYLLDKVRVREIMARAVITITPLFPIEEAARLMVQERIGALPVTEAGDLVGIVTETDLLELFVNTMGAGEPSGRLEVLLDSRPGGLVDIARALEEAGVIISSLVTLRNRDGIREAVVRIATLHTGPAIEALQARGYTVRDADRQLR
jgi:acetoin utilization protein AcuB